MSQVLTSVVAVLFTYEIPGPVILVQSNHSVARMDQNPEELPGPTILIRLNSSVAPMGFILGELPTLIPIIYFGKISYFCGDDGFYS